jgi:hypothetical protein
MSFCCPKEIKLEDGTIAEDENMDQRFCLGFRVFLQIH